MMALELIQIEWKILKMDEKKAAVAGGARRGCQDIAVRRPARPIKMGAFLDSLRMGTFPLPGFVYGLKAR